MLLLPEIIACTCCGKDIEMSNAMWERAEYWAVAILCDTCDKRIYEGHQRAVRYAMEQQALRHQERLAQGLPAVDPDNLFDE